MLTLNNIEKLKGTYIGKWEVMGVSLCDNSEHHINAEHYNIRLLRGDIGAAIQIERNMGNFGYNVHICYENYDRFITMVVITKKELLDKHNFFASMRGFLDSEYDKYN